MRKIGINFHAFPGLSDEAYLEKMVELGFSTTFYDMIEVGHQEYLANLFAKHNIECEAFTIWSYQ